MESGVCGDAAEFDIAGTGVLSTRGSWKGHAAFPLRQLACKQSRGRSQRGSRADTRKVVKRSSTVVAVFKCDRFPPTHPNARERGVLWARISRWSKCRDQFRLYGELGQRREVVCGLARRSVIRCFLRSGVLTSRRPLYPEFCGKFYGRPCPGWSTSCRDQFPFHRQLGQNVN